MTARSFGRIRVHQCTPMGSVTKYESKLDARLNQFGGGDGGETLNRVKINLVYELALSRPQKK